MSTIPEGSGPLTVDQYRRATEEVRRLATQLIAVELAALDRALADGASRRARAKQAAADLEMLRMRELIQEISEAYPDNKSLGAIRLEEATAERLSHKENQ